MVKKFSPTFTWQEVGIHPYKEEGNHFRSITRQTLLPGTPGMPTELRYFEIQPGGHSTLERHHHEHMVVVIRGKGQVLVGDQITDIDLHDVVSVPPMTWHQFQASRGETLGFLCVVNQERDKPQRPSDEEASTLPAQVQKFIKR
ncbi:MAG: cupin domain-containing protein [Fimbriimonadaceae bacterium]|nr:cupin domain-containing protein [Fimbriimonadaceae bacterium]